MDWKNRFDSLEKNKEFELAIEFIRKVIGKNPNDVKAYIRAIYLLHNILLEEDYSESQQDSLAELICSYFEISYKKFSNNAEYLFFIGKILYVGEWHFGVKDDFKPIEERQAFQMQEKAHQLEKENILFKWAVRFSLGDKLAGDLATHILDHDKNSLEWLKSYGFAGDYILNALKFSRG